MNPNDILAQQQAVVNQALQHYQTTIWGLWVVQIALLLLTGWVIYMFYARLRDIADELRRFRIAYEMGQERAVRGQSRAPTTPAADNPLSGEARYMPRK